MTKSVVVLIIGGVWFHLSRFPPGGSLEEKLQNWFYLSRISWARRHLVNFEQKGSFYPSHMRGKRALWVPFLPFLLDTGRGSTPVWFHLVIAMIIIAMIIIVVLVIIIIMVIIIRIVIIIVTIVNMGVS
jgi:hypothetical protein